MREVAREIIEDPTPGSPPLSFRALAEKLELSPSAPLYYFGTFSGLLGAVASEAFTEIAGELRSVRSESTTDDGNLAQLARCYVMWALQHAALYQAIHSADLWGSSSAPIAAGQGRQNPPSETARERAESWLEQAEGARNLAFYEFAQAAASLPITHGAAPTLDHNGVARLVTVIADGYLFQYLNEHVGRDGDDPLGREHAADEVEALVAVALSGVFAGGTETV